MLAKTGFAQAGFAQNGHDQSMGERTILERLGDAIVFVVFLMISAFTLATIAVATPIVIAVAALIGLFTADRRHKSWRRAGA